MFDNRHARHRLSRALCPSRVLLTVFLLTALASGCSEPPPPIATHAVTGRITYKNGEPMAGGIVEFRSKHDQTLNMSAFTEEDGSFSLVTIYKNQNVSGAIEGPCQVTITLPIVEPIPTSFELPDPYVVEAGDNHFEIQLDKDPKTAERN